MLRKEQSVKVKILHNNLISPYIDILDRCHRGKDKTGWVHYPAYATLNRYWYVKHDDDTTAIYHESELEPYERPKAEAPVVQDLFQNAVDSRKRSLFYNPLDD